MTSLRIHQDIEAALGAGRPVVALETAVLTHGLPRRAMGQAPACKPPGWRIESPINLETMRAMQRALHEAGAVPAVIAVDQGSLCAGVDDGSVASLAVNEEVLKASARDVAPILAARQSAGTTVSATLAACALTMVGQHSSRSSTDNEISRTRHSTTGTLPGLRVFATGGIGGVHRDWTRTADVSGDLIELSQTPACVVCSGPKAVLDVAATAEALEALGVTVLGYQTDTLPQFYSAGDASLRIAHRVQGPEEVAAVCRAQWLELGRSAGVLVCQPPPAAHALPHEAIIRMIDQAHADAGRAGIRGASITPFLLERVATLSGGKSLEANIALLIENARLAGHIAAALAIA